MGMSSFVQVRHHEIEVTDGEGQPVRGQLTVEFPTGHRRLDRRRAGSGVNRNLFKLTEINQQAVVAQREPDPAVPPPRTAIFIP